jgi:MFS family permease
LRTGGKIELMEPESGSRSGFSLTRFSLRGSAGLIVAVAVVAILLIALPAYRWFFLISLLIGLVIAGGLTLWHKLHPLKEQDVEPKRPLGL